MVSIAGSRLPGTFPLIEEMRISDLLEDGGGLQPNYADVDYALLVREELADEGDIKVSGIDLRGVLATPGGQQDVSLLPKDQIILFSKNENKALALAEVVERLKLQAKLGELAKVVRSAGSVEFPGEYPFTEDMSINDLIVLSGGLIPEAYSQSAEIYRINLQDPNRAQTSIVVANLNQSRQMRLGPMDHAEFRVVPDYAEIETISLEGEFVFPGSYAFGKGEKLMSVIERAGGFSEGAFIEGSVFLRTSLKQREQEEIERLLQALNLELSTDDLRAANLDMAGAANLGMAVDQDKKAAQQRAASVLSTMEATGRLVIPLADIASGLSEDVLLKDGDRLLVPEFRQELTIIGEVQRPSSYFYDANSSLSDYIERSGGYTARADKGGVYVVSASGKVSLQKRSLFRFASLFRRANAISPGDTIVVPLNIDDNRLLGIPLLAEVSTIIYQLALGSAALKSFNN